MKKNTIPINVLKDTREQTPFTFVGKDNVEIIESTLKGGDYTLLEHCNYDDDYSVLIERKKNCLELSSNLGKNWERFQRQLEIMQQYKIKYIVVESPKDFFSIYKRKIIKAHPNFLESRIYEINVRYGIPVIFFNSKKEAENFVYNIFRKIRKISEDD